MATIETDRPPGPAGIPVLGNLPEFGADPIAFFSRCARDYGDVVGLKIGSWNGCFINHPEHIERVLLTSNTKFIKHRFFWRHVTEIFGKGLVTNEGSSWLRQRRLAQPAFHRDRISGYGDVMVEYTREMLDAWDREAAGAIHDEMMRATMAIVTKTLFGSQMAEGEMRAIGRAFDDAVEAIAIRFRRPFRIPEWVPLPSNVRYRRAVRDLDRLVYSMIEERRRDPGEDLLSMLLAARDEDGSAMSERQLRDEAVTIFLAGHETTALTLSWTFHLLALHPVIQDRLIEEVDAVLGSRAATAADLPALSMANRVVQESMRLYPPAYAFGRESIEDVEIGGYVLPKGTTVFMSPWVIHRDPRFFEDPDAFRPERWENDFAKTLPRFTYIPFGGGPRLCIGNSFAMMEAVLMLATILQRYRVEPDGSGREAKPFASITLRPPAEGLPLRIVART